MRIKQQTNHQVITKSIRCHLSYLRNRKTCQVTNFSNNLALSTAKILAQMVSEPLRVFLLNSLTAFGYISCSSRMSVLGFTSDALVKILQHTQRYIVAFRAPPTNSRFRYKSFKWRWIPGTAKWYIKYSTHSEMQASVFSLQRSFAPFLRPSSHN